MEKAEAAKINVVKAAEADAEAKFLQGQARFCAVFSCPGGASTSVALSAPPL